ncbi:MAG: type 2 lanthipeptide synthetase LanM [Eubacteriales bacterium]|nr:type 2 lanthipeptide synthetase LanM [Eubacteriales bacterium]
MFEKFCEYAAEIFPLQEQKISSTAENISIEYDIKELVKDQLISSIGNIALRTLILDIHRKKEEGRLLGATPEEQYDYYNNVWMDKETHMQALFQEFPELYRLILLEVSNTYSMASEIVRNLQADKGQIVKSFCSGQDFTGIAELQFTGDSHNGGKRTARVRLDNGAVLYYKPHSLRRNKQYQSVYGYLCEKAGSTYKKVQYLSRDTYGWEENVENRSCKTKEEVDRYYFRMGIHLFIGYALSATDLHGENIVAHGEHPVIVDMETFPGYFIQTEEGSADRKTETILAGSVIHTGMLPVLTWGQGSQTVVMSAMGNGAKITTPFRMPVVKKPETSEMYIDYEPLEFEMKECVVRLKGQAVNGGDYVEKLIQGFQSAYLTVLTDNYVKELLSGFFYGTSRIVLRHTQQYVMYWIASLHPDYMGGIEQRKSLLSVIHKAGETQLQRKIHDYEISDLVQNEIPYFEMEGMGRGIYDGNGGYYENYFPCTPYDGWKKHMNQMTLKDMQKQCDLIRISIAMLCRRMPDNKWETYNSQPPSASLQKYRLKEQIQEIVTWICENAVVAGEDIQWIGLQFCGRERWRLVPSEMYLYSGISGIVLFLSEYLRIFKHSKAQEIFDLSVKKMMRYTDGLEVRRNCEVTRKTGLIDGESSFISIYLYLYKLTGKNSYLRYAEKHFYGIQYDLLKDTGYDYLSGNAGAVIAILELYRITKNQSYLDLAVQTEETLWSRRQENEHGCGWKLEHMQKPLAGMAHGNSGFLMAYADLYQVSGDVRYLKKIHSLLEYEDSLYSEEAGNWIDLRESEQETHTMNAWCHGAPGILLSRLKLESILDSEKVSTDIRRASQALFTGEYGGQICLCHGLAGNLLIMQKYLEVHDSPEFKRRYVQGINSLLDRLQDKQKLSAAEYLNPAFMNGISGVGYALIKFYKTSHALQ